MDPVPTLSAKCLWLPDGTGATGLLQWALGGKTPRVFFLYYRFRTHLDFLLREEKTLRFLSALGVKSLREGKAVGWGREKRYLVAAALAFHSFSFYFHRVKIARRSRGKKPPSSF